MGSLMPSRPDTLRGRRRERNARERDAQAGLCTLLHDPDSPVSAPHASRSCGGCPHHALAQLTRGPLRGRTRGHWAAKGDKPPSAEVPSLVARCLPRRADLTCQGAEDEEEAVAAHGGAVGRRAGLRSAACADVF